MLLTVDLPGSPWLKSCWRTGLDGGETSSAGKEGSKNPGGDGLCRPGGAVNDRGEADCAGVDDEDKEASQDSVVFSGMPVLLIISTTRFRGPRGREIRKVVQIMPAEMQALQACRVFSHCICEWKFLCMWLD